MLSERTNRTNETRSRISYELPDTLQEGEYSFIAQGVDEGNAGSKVKVMSMAEGGGDVTANDYRMTIEVRGRDYTTSRLEDRQEMTARCRLGSRFSASARSPI